MLAVSLPACYLTQVREEKRKKRNLLEEPGKKGKEIDHAARERWIEQRSSRVSGGASGRRAWKSDVPSLDRNPETTPSHRKSSHDFLPAGIP